MTQHKKLTQNLIFCAMLFSAIPTSLHAQANPPSMSPEKTSQVAADLRHLEETRAKALEATNKPNPLRLISGIAVAIVIAEQLMSKKKKE